MTKKKCCTSVCAIFTSDLLDNTDKLSPNPYYRRHSPCSLPKMLCSQICPRNANLRILRSANMSRGCDISHMSPLGHFCLHSPGETEASEILIIASAQPFPLPHTQCKALSLNPGLDFAIKYLSANLIFMKQDLFFHKKSFK